MGIKNSKKENHHLTFEAPSPIYIVGLISFFTLFSTEMILNVLPLFTIAIGGTPLILRLIAGVLISLIFVTFFKL